VWWREEKQSTLNGVLAQCQLQQTGGLAVCWRGGGAVHGCR
jgi:hypothetical protein